ncbi:MAG: hypothetical protein UIH27_15235 [Ruminococcus sp.]|nr:hypothetical protein [Ruminococcus sp.]
MIYQEVLLDSALFKKELTPNAKAFITTNKTVLSATFFPEVKAYTKVLDAGYAKILTSNLHTIISMLTSGGKILLYVQPFDICQRAEQLSASGYKVCVVTEDCLLIDRLLNGSAVNADVYDLNRDSLTPHHSRPSNVCTVDKTTTHERIDGVTTGTVLRTRNAFSHTLGERLTEDGAEGYVYHVAGKSDIVAKIYKTPPSYEKRLHLEKLLAVGKEARAPWCAFPDNLLYHNGALVGFTMPKIYCRTMSEDSLYLGDDEDIAEDRLDNKLTYQLDFCITLLTQIKVLNCFGISIPDFNDTNFSTYTDGKPVVMYDADSFVYGSYFGNFIDDKAFSRPYRHNNKEQLAQMCEENALKMVFRILSLGMYPFAGEDQPYLFVTGNKDLTYRRQYFPDNVLNRLDAVFSAREPASLGLVLFELSEARGELLKMPKKNITLHQMRDNALSSIGIQPPKQNFSGNTYAESFASYNSAAPDSNSQPKKSRKKHILPWIALLSALAGGIFWLLISQGIITL